MPLSLLPPAPLCHHCVLVLEINQGPLLGKGFLLERETELDTSLPSHLPSPCQDLLPKLPRQSPKDAGGGGWGRGKAFLGPLHLSLTLTLFPQAEP